MTDPWLDDGDVRLYHGDVCEVLAGLPDESVDCVVTSPPYWGLRDYGTEGQIGLEPTPDLYVQQMVAVFREVRRVLAAHGTCWVNLGDSYATAGGHQQTEAELEAEQAKGWFGDERGRYPTRATKSGRAANTAVAGLKAKDLCGIPWRVARALQEPYYTGRIRDERDRIWLAATVEAEGCMFIHRRKAGSDSGAKFTKKDGTEMSYARTQDSFGAGLEVASTDRVVAERCMAITGIGSISEQGPNENHRRKQTIYRWNVRSNECKWIIAELYPHMIAKQHEARLLLGCPSSGDDARKAWESLKALHQGQSADIDFRPPEGMWEEGWFLRSDIIWAKCRPNPMPESVTDRPTKSHEYVFLLTKQPRYFFDQEAVREKYGDPTREWWNETATTPGNPDRKDGGGIQSRPAPGPDGRRKTGVLAGDGSIQHRDGERWPNLTGRNVRSVWHIATQPYPEAHFATYPEELVRRCVLAGCKPGGTVLDPFVGSGTTCKVARDHGRHSIGIDLSEPYLELAARRLQQLSLLTAPPKEGFLAAPPADVASDQ